MSNKDDGEVGGEHWFGVGCAGGGCKKDAGGTSKEAGQIEAGGKKKLGSHKECDFYVPPQLKQT